MLWLVIGIILLIIAIGGGVIVNPILFVLAILALAAFFFGGSRGRAVSGTHPPCAREAAESGPEPGPASDARPLDATAQRRLAGCLAARLKVTFICLMRLAGSPLAPACVAVK